MTNSLRIAFLLFAGLFAGLLAALLTTLFGGSALAADAPRVALQQGPCVHELPLSYQKNDAPC
jgi:hypothetical protein